MQIRPLRAQDIPNLSEIDGTIEATQYLHVDRSGQGSAITWKIEPRPLREKLIEPNHLSDIQTTSIRHVINDIEEGIAYLAEHDDQPVGLILAQINQETGTLQILDLRVDYDQRRQGIGSVLLFEAIKIARERQLRAVSVQIPGNNHRAAEFLQKTGFDMAGLDTLLHSNHDLVKESVSLFWYLPLT